MDTTTEKAKPAQTVASAKRPATNRSQKTVKLTPSQVAIAKRIRCATRRVRKTIKHHEGGISIWKI